jgi:hypothetical protein
MATEDFASPNDRRAAPNLSAFDVVQPWQKRKDWASGKLYYRAGFARGIKPGIFGMILLSAAFLFARALPSSMQAYSTLALIPLIILVPAGLAVTITAMGLVIGGFKTGRVILQLDAVPVALGGRLGGLLRMSKPVPAGQPLRIKLECTRWITYTNDGRYTDDSSVSTDSMVVCALEQMVVSDGTGAIPVSIATPTSAPSTEARATTWVSAGSTNTRVEWWLTVEDPSGKASERHAEFEVPVFQAGEIPGQVAESPQPVDRESIRAARAVQLESYQPGPDFKVRIVALRDGCSEFNFPPAGAQARARFQTVILLMMGGILFAVSDPLFTYLSTDAGQRDGAFGVALYVGWAILTMLLLARVLRLWLAPEQITIANGMLTYTSGLFARTRRVPVAEIQTIRAVATYGRWSAIRIRRVRSRPLTVGEGIYRGRDDEWLAMQISRAAAVKLSKPEDELAEEREKLQRLQTLLAGRGIQGGRVWRRGSPPEV